MGKFNLKVSNVNYFSFKKGGANDNNEIKKLIKLYHKEKELYLKTGLKKHKLVYKKYKNEIFLLN
jgi:hypothetical protein